MRKFTVWFEIIGRNKVYGHDQYTLWPLANGRADLAQLLVAHRNRGHKVTRGTSDGARVYRVEYTR